MELKRLPYPKTPEKLDLRRKLLSKDIKHIHQLYEKGFTKKAIAEKMQVSIHTIYYWTMSKEERNQKNAKRWINKLPDKEQQHSNYIKTYKRKKEIQLEELKQYHNILTAKQKLDNPEKYKEWQNKYISTHPKERKEIRKKSYLKHKEQRKETARLYRQNNPEKIKKWKRKAYIKNKLTH